MKSLIMKTFARVVVFIWILIVTGTTVPAQVPPFLEPLANSEPFSVAPEELHRQAGELPVPEQANSEVLIDWTSVSFDNEGRETITYRQVYRILTEAGIDQYSSISAAWAPWHQKRPVLKARVIDKRGKAHELHDSEISEAPVQRGDNLFSDKRVLQAPLPAVETGAIIETLVILEDTQPMFAGGVGSPLLFHTAEPTRWFQLKISAPETLPLHVKAFGEALKPTDETRGGRRELSWSLDRHLTFEDFEANVPPAETQGTQVCYVTGKSWNDVAVAYQSLIEKQLEDESLQSTASSLLEGETDRTKKIEKLLYWMQSQIRYTGLLFGDGTIVPSAPSDVIRRRYGDCKDQSILLAGMLRASGIEAWPVLLRSSQGWDVHSDMPNISFFNHMIVYVPGAPDLWIDPTAPLLPLGELPLADQGRRCLIIRPETKELTLSPVMPAADSQVRIERDIQLGDLKGVTVQERSVYTGILAQDIRAFAVSNGDKELRNWIRDIGMSRLSSSEVGGIRFSALRDLSKPAEFSYDSESAGIAEFNLRGGEVALRPGTILDVLPAEVRDLRPYLTDTERAEIRANYDGEREIRLQNEKQRRRRYSLNIREPQTMEFTVRVHVPAGFEVSEIPKPFSLRRGDMYLEGRCELSAENSVLTASYRAGTGNAPLSPEDLEWWQNSLRSLFPNGNEGEWNPIVKVNHPLAELLISDPKRAIQQLREEGQRNPENLANELRLAEALLQVGLVEGAREIGERAVLKAPASSEAHFYASVAYDTGVLGSEQTASDRRRQTELLKKAVELDPENVLASLDLARMYQVDHRQIVNSKEDLEAAVRLLTKHRDRLTAEFLKLLLQCHFYLGNYREILAETESLPADQVLLGLRFAAHSELKGFDSAMTELKASFDEKGQVAILLAAYDMLNGIRSYPTALKTLQTVEALPSGRLEGLRELIDVAKNMARHDDLLRPETEVEGVVQRAWIYAATGRAPLGDPTLLVDGSEHEREILLRRLYQASLGGQSDGKTIRAFDRVVDAISLLKIEVEGSEEAAFRVTAKLSGQMVLFVVRRDERLRIVGTYRQPGLVCDSVLTLIDSQQLEAARQVLTWMSDSMVDQLSFLNPAVGPVLPRLWKKSVAKEATAEQMKLAALSLADSSTLAAHISFLQEQREKAKKAEQFQIDRILVVATAAAGDHELTLTVANRLCETRSGATEFWPVKLDVLRRLQRLDEADSFLASQTASDPKSIAARTQMAYNAGARGQYGIAAEYFQQNAETRKATISDFNMSAWSALFVDPERGHILDHAEKGAREQFAADSAGLHTLATVQAERGMTALAMQSLKQCILIREDQKPRPDDFYVAGRVAELLGLSELAQSYYQKVLDHSRDNSNPFATRRLALIRLDQMKMP